MKLLVVIGGGRRISGQSVVCLCLSMLSGFGDEATGWRCCWLVGEWREEEEDGGGGRGGGLSVEGSWVGWTGLAGLG